MTTSQDEVDHGTSSASGSASRRARSAGRERFEPVAAPRPLPAGEREDAVEDAGGEAPDEQARGRPKPGPTYPLGCGTRNRLAGSRSSATGTRTARATSARSTASTGDGGPPPGEHRRHGVVADRQVEVGQGAGDDDARRRRAPSPRAPRARRRRAGPASVVSTRPPGKATWPGCARRPAARSVSRTSGPAGPSPNSSRTAERRWCPAAGRSG